MNDFYGLLIISVYLYLLMSDFIHSTIRIRWYIYIFIYFCSQVFTNIYTYKPPTLIGIGDKNAHENEMPCNAWVANYMLTNPGRKVWLCLCTSCTL